MANTNLPDADPTTQPHRTYLFGTSIAHSLSPLLHNTVYRATHTPWTYTLHDSPSIPAFLALLHDPQCIGSSVTMPHKITIAPHLDELTPESRAIGAVNTVLIRPTANGRRYIGTNTDVVGVREALRRNVPDQAAVHGRPALVIGGGGAARSAIYALNTWLACPSVYIVNRDADEVAATRASCVAGGFGANVVHVRDAAHAATLPTPAAVVACVPDVEPATPAELCARGAVMEMLQRPDKGVVLEMAYHPRVRTAFARIAQGLGWRIVYGTEAMVWQGLEQERLWMGRGLDERVVQEVRRAVESAVEAESKTDAVK